MDIGNLRTADTAEDVLRLVLEHPTTGVELEHDGIPMIAMIKSQNSKAYKRSASKAINASEAAKKRGNDSFDLESEETKGANILASCTVSLKFYSNNEWLEYKKDDGKDDFRAIKQAYLDFPWLAEQVRTASKNPANFWKLSQSNLNSGSSNDAGTAAVSQRQNNQD